MSDHPHHIQHDHRRGDLHWTRRAACRDQPPQPFTDPHGCHDLHTALATCATCAVRRPCLTTALTHPADADIGIWGGTTEHSRQRIRTGKLTIDDALARGPRTLSRAREHPPPTVATAPPPAAQAVPATNTAQPRRPGSHQRLAAPEITVARDRHGDYTDTTGRVIIFRIHGDPPWMLMIDRRCIQRTRTLTQARQVAWTVLHPPQRTTSHSPRRS